MHNLTRFIGNLSATTTWKRLKPFSVFADAFGRITSASPLVKMRIAQPSGLIWFSTNHAKKPNVILLMRWKRLEPFAIIIESLGLRAGKKPLRIMQSAKSPSSMRFATDHTRRTSMIPIMFFLGLAQNKIAQSVIIPLSVEVVHLFTRFQITANVFFNNKPMLDHSAISFAKWVTSSNNCNISIPIKRFASSVCRVLLGIQKLKCFPALLASLWSTLQGILFSDKSAAVHAVGKFGSVAQLFPFPCSVFAQHRIFGKGNNSALTLQAI